MLAALFLLPARAGFAQSAPSEGFVGAVDTWFKQVMELREADRSKAELEHRIRALETERDRLMAERQLKEGDARRMEEAIAALRSRSEKEARGEAILWISTVETALLRDGVAPKTALPLTVVTGSAEQPDGTFTVRWEGAEYRARLEDFAEEQEILAHLARSADKLEEEAARLTASLDQVEGKEREEWTAHIERMKTRVGAIRQARREVEAAFAQWRNRMPPTAEPPPQP